MTRKEKRCITIGAEIERCGPENGGQKRGHTDNGQKNGDAKRKEAVKPSQTLKTRTDLESPKGFIFLSLPEIALLLDLSQSHQTAIRTSGC